MTQEHNEQNWRGVRPVPNADPIPVGKIPDGGTQVDDSVTANNEIELVHSVTAGKTLYVNVLIISNRNETESVARCYLMIYDATDTIAYNMIYYTCPAGDGKIASVTFPTPLELASLWKIKVMSVNDENKVTVFVHGYEA